MGLYMALYMGAFRVIQTVGVRFLIQFCVRLSRDATSPRTATANQSLHHGIGAFRVTAGRVSVPILYTINP